MCVVTRSLRGLSLDIWSIGQAVTTHVVAGRPFVGTRHCQYNTDEQQTRNGKNIWSSIPWDALCSLNKISYTSAKNKVVHQTLKCQMPTSKIDKERQKQISWVECPGLGYLPGGHLPPPKFGHLPPPNSDFSHPQKKTFARRTTATPNFFFFFWRTFLGFFDLQLMEDIKDGKEEVLDEVVMEHIK